MGGRRIYFHGYRIHHGLAGLLLSVAALPLLVIVAPAVALVAGMLGVLLMLHDRTDFPWRLRD